jgi:hypothetical protein
MKRPALRLALWGVILCLILAPFAVVFVAVRAIRFSEWANEHSVRAQMYGGPEISRHARHHLEMEKKYRYAADHPWLPVAPDPPDQWD